MSNRRRFEILYPDYHGIEWDNCATITAFDHEEAAEKWAEYDDQRGDYSIIGRGESESIHVREEGSMDIKTFKVFAESCPHYSAKELK